MQNQHLRSLMELSKMKKIELVSYAQSIEKQLKAKENSLTQLKRGKTELKREVSFLEDEKSKLDKLIENIIKPFIVEVGEKVDALKLDDKGNVLFPQFWQLSAIWNTVFGLYQIGKCAVRLFISIYKLLFENSEEEVPEEGQTFG